MMTISSGINSFSILSALIALSLTGFVSCSSEKTETQTPEKFPVTRAIRKDTAYQQEYVADIHSIQNTEIRTKATGFLEKIHVDEGQYVRVGQLLFTLGSQQYQQELTKAQSALASAIAETKAAEVELKNTKALAEKNIVSLAQLEVAQARYEALQANTEEARAQEANAQLQLSYSQIKAPFNGYINRIPYKVGSLINEGTLLTTISNNDEMLVYFNVSERDYLDFATSAISANSKQVSLVLANGSLYEHRGVIETTESEIDKSTGTLAFRARFPNPKNLLKHGSSGKILMPTLLNDALLIPQKSTFEVQENIYVFVVDKNNHVQTRRVVPSVRLQWLYVISDGLTEDDKFIYEGIQRVREGDEVSPELVELVDVIKKSK